MTLSTRWLAGLATAALFATLAAGCREPDRAAVTPADLSGRTTGTPAELSEHLGRLERKFKAGQVDDPDTARANLSAYTKAVIETTNAIIDNPATDDAMREKAVAFQFLIYERRRSIDPNAENEMLAAADRIESKAVKPVIKFLACEKKTGILGQRAATASDEDRPQKYRALVDAVIHTVSLDPPPPRSSEVLGNLANECESKRLHALAKEIDEVLVAKFPDTLDAKFAKGALHRHNLKGKLIDDIQGLGRDGKPLSIKDFRGKVVVLTFWVSSLEPSVMEVEEVDAFRTKYDPKDLQIIGVALDPAAIAEVSNKLLDQKKITWPQLQARIINVDLESELTLRYGIRSFLYKMVIDREGRLVDFGYLFSEVRPTVERLLPPPQEPKRPEEKGSTKTGATEAPTEK